MKSLEDYVSMGPNAGLLQIKDDYQLSNKQFSTVVDIYNTSYSRHKDKYGQHKEQFEAAIEEAKKYVKQTT